MSDIESSVISNEEAFETSYSTFIFCLEALASSAEEACGSYGNFNVAWEIKDDVSAGIYLSNNPAHRLSAEHIIDIHELSTALEAIPKDILNFTNKVEESLENMRHPAWEPIREQAKHLIRKLVHVTEINKKYFSGASGGC